MIIRGCVMKSGSQQNAKTAADFLHRALKHFESEFSVTIKVIITDNGKESICHNKRGRVKHKFERAMVKHQIKHRYTRPYRPQTNGKIERFWRIWNEEYWQRETFRDWQNYDRGNGVFMRRYNYWRRHGGIARTTPHKRLQAWRKNKVESLACILQPLTIKVRRS